MIPVKEVMTRDVITFREDTPVDEIATTLASKHITGAPVMGKDGHVSGIVSEVDVFSKKGKVARDIMSSHVITEMTRLNLAVNGPERAINFAQGFPDFETDPRILEAAAVALRDGYNQYATTWGAPQLRQAVAKKQSAAWDREVDPET